MDWTPYGNFGINVNDGHGGEIQVVYGLSPNAKHALRNQILREHGREATAMRLLEDLTPGGSEFVNDPQRCYDFIKARLEGAQHAAVAARVERNRLEEEEFTPDGGWFGEDTRKIRHEMGG